MISPARKPLTVVTVVVAIAILSVAVLAQFGGKPSSPVVSGSKLSSSTASLTQPTSTSISSSDGRIPFFIGVGQNLTLFATPSVTLNYTFVVSQFVAGSSHVSLSATSTVAGVTLAVDPNEFTFLGSQEAVFLGISVAPTVNSSILPVQIAVTSANGTTSTTFDFSLDKALIVIAGVNLNPPILHVSVGQKVTWLDIVEPDDDGNGYANITLANGLGASPTMGRNNLWSHTFDRPGTYQYDLTVFAATISGVVIVS